MKKITSFTVFEDGGFQEISFTYKEVDSSGKIVKENERMSLVVMDDEQLRNIDDMKNYLLNKVNDNA